MRLRYFRTNGEDGEVTCPERLPADAEITGWKTGYQPARDGYFVAFQSKSFTSTDKGALIPFDEDLAASAEEVNEAADQLGQSHLDEIIAERQKVYGEPKQNHQFIAQAWTGLLHPHAEAIARGEPVPAHTVALMMAALKVDRMRLTFHQDNFDDAEVYLKFAQQWQKEDCDG
jgi:hypothetical protein